MTTTEVHSPAEHVVYPHQSVDDMIGAPVDGSPDLAFTPEPDDDDDAPADEGGQA